MAGCDIDCLHRFHFDCIHKWVTQPYGSNLNSQIECPVCRHPVGSIIKDGVGSAAPEQTRVPERRPFNAMSDEDDEDYSSDESRESGSDSDEDDSDDESMGEAGNGMGIPLPVPS
mmetsp:Transcript_32690/g.83672  ORF Transcript_32690/g.83672 Transcript_32690/m.83672 type:complete len:115 (-) Transcript_32690:1795-2139(-)